MSMHAEVGGNGITDKTGVLFGNTFGRIIQNKFA